MLPWTKVIRNNEVHQLYVLDIICNAGFEVVTDDYTFLPFDCVHDVVTYGFTWNYKDKSIIYATDTSTLEHAPKGPYDYLFIESNHCEKKLDLVMGQNKGGYNPYLSGKRHLSTQESKLFYYWNRRDRDSECVELHKSSRFY